jgi:Arc/MetJ family transcription regulator
MRTTIILDDDLLKRAQQLTGIRTKRELINVALRALVRLHEQPAAHELRGKLHWGSDLKESRRERIHEGKS